MIVAHLDYYIYRHMVALCRHIGRNGRAMAPEIKSKMKERKSTLVKLNKKYAVWPLCKLLVK